MTEQKQVPNQFTTTCKQDAFAMLEILLANNYECSISTDYEGMYMIFYDRPEYGGCYVEWVDPDTQEVIDIEQEDN